MALDGADLTCRLAEGHGLVTIRDYGDHQRPGDPSASWIVRVLGGGCWVSALSAAGIGAERYLEPILIRGSGARTRPGGGEAWSLPERVDALALAIERNHGYELTKDVWEHYRDIVPFETPTYPTLKGSRTKNGKATSQYTLAQMHELARKLILREPERFPVAAAHVQLVAAVRAKERRRKAKPRRKAA